MTKDFFFKIIGLFKVCTLKNNLRTPTHVRTLKNKKWQWGNWYLEAVETAEVAEAAEVN